MASSFELRGQQAMRRRLENIARMFPTRMKAALRAEAEAIMTTSKREHVPVDLGTLRSSGHVQPPIQKGNEIECTMAYGGAAAAYAAAIHEHPSSMSPPSWQGAAVTFSPPGRGPKYLERPMMDAMPGMAKRIAERFSADLAADAKG